MASMKVNVLEYESVVAKVDVMDLMRVGMMAARSDTWSVECLGFELAAAMAAKSVLLLAAMKVPYLVDM